MLGLLHKLERGLLGMGKTISLNLVSINVVQIRIVIYNFFLLLT